MATENHDQIIHQILASGDAYDDLLHRPLLEATRRIAQGLPVSASLRTQILDDVMELWQENPFIQTRAVINEIFSQISNPEFANEVSTRLLARCAQEPIEDWGGAELARIAGKLGKHKEATTILITMSQKEVEEQGAEYEAIEALVALYEIGEKAKTASLLLEIARKPRYYPDETKVAALELIAKFYKSDPQLTRDLLELARDLETEPEVRIAAARALARLNESEVAIPVLREITWDLKVEDGDRRRAARTLDEAGERELAISALLELMQDSRTHKVVACHAAEDLVDLGQREIGMQFLTNAAQPGAPCVICDSVTCGCGHEFIAEKLVKLGEREVATALLLSVLNDRAVSAYSRANHAAILGELGQTQVATSALLEIMRSVETSDYAYGVALRGLGKWGERNEAVLNILLTAAQDKSLKLSQRMYAIEALGDFGNSSPRVLDVLAELARTSSYPHTAYEALWKLLECSSVKPTPSIMSIQANVG